MIIPFKKVKLAGRVISGFAFNPDKRLTLSTHFQKNADRTANSIKPE
jgi:hypothetical protein